ncbi:14671_t:CDS:2 [Entrophospora sp. SA101]|nr:14671_t:CDS:2 [Entrophospora sp. SA101]
MLTLIKAFCLPFSEGSKGKGLYDVEESDDEHEDSEDDEYSEDEDESNKNIEDTLFEYAKNLEHEDDENVKKLFTKQEWDELTQENLEAFEIPDDILEHLKFYNQDTMEGVRSKLMKPYLKNDENYDTNSNYDYEWIHLSIRSVINLWENKDSPLSRTQYENWYSVNLFGSRLDFCFRTVKDLDIKNAKVVAEKTKFSMFVPEIENALKNHNIKSIVLFGIEAHVCILQTALDLIENNYDIHVLADGVSSMNYPEIEIALNHIQQAGGSVTSSESILFQLLNDSSDQKFKQISSLVKEYRKETSENKLMFKSNL